MNGFIVVRESSPVATQVFQVRNGLAVSVAFQQPSGTLGTWMQLDDDCCWEVDPEVPVFTTPDEALDLPL